MSDPSAIARLLMGEPPPSNLPAYSWTPQPQGSLTNPYNDAMAKMGTPVVSAIAKLLAAPVNAARDFTQAHMGEYQPGATVGDMPQTMQALPSAAMGAVGMPGGVGGLGSGVRLRPAVKFGDEVFTGINHGDAYEAAIRKLGYDPLSAGSGPRGANIAERRNLNGFLTEDGRFVDRGEAGWLAGLGKPAMAHDLE